MRNQLSIDPIVRTCFASTQKELSTFDIKIAMGCIPLLKNILHLPHQTAVALWSRRQGVLCQPHQTGQQHCCTSEGPRSVGPPGRSPHSLGGLL